MLKSGDIEICGLVVWMFFVVWYCLPDRRPSLSCNPETLARDLKYLTKNGYKAEKAVACDMFPHTNHVETVVLMSRKDK